MISVGSALLGFSSFRRDAKRYAADAIRQAIAGHVQLSDESWAKARDAAARACALQAYVNGFRHGRQSEREGSR